MNHRSTRIDDLECHVARRSCFDVEINWNSVRRIWNLRLVFLQRRSVVVGGTDVDRVSRLEQMRIRFENRIVDLSQRTDVVYHPEAPTVRRDNEIVSVNLDVAHRRRGDVELERLPVLTVIERSEHAAFGSREKQSSP